MGKQRILNTPIKNFQNIAKMPGMSSDGFFNCEGTSIGIPGADRESDSEEFVLPPLNLRVFVAADQNNNIFSTIPHCCSHKNIVPTKTITVLPRLDSRLINSRILRHHGYETRVS